MTTTPNPGPTRTPKGVEIDFRIGAATLRAPAASMEDSRPQAILKFHRLSSLDYRACHGLPVGYISYIPLAQHQAIIKNHIQSINITYDRYSNYNVWLQYDFV